MIKSWDQIFFLSFLLLSYYFPSDSMDFQEHIVILYIISATFPGIPSACFILQKCFGNVAPSSRDDQNSEAELFILGKLMICTVEHLLLGINRLNLSSRERTGHLHRPVLSLETRNEEKVLLSFSRWALGPRIPLLSVGACIRPPHQDFPGYHCINI